MLWIDMNNMPKIWYVETDRDVIELKIFTPSVCS